MSNVKSNCWHFSMTTSEPIKFSRNSAKLLLDNHLGLLLWTLFLHRSGVELCNHQSNVSPVDVIVIVARYIFYSIAVRALHIPIHWLAQKSEHHFERTTEKVMKIKSSINEMVVKKRALAVAATSTIDSNGHRMRSSKTQHEITSE